MTKYTACLYLALICGIGAILSNGSEGIVGTFLFITTIGLVIIWMLGDEEK